MSDLISRKQAIETAIKIACNLDSDWEYEQIASAMDYALEQIPSAEKTGKWLHERLLSTTGGTYPVTRCSVCQNTMPFEWETPYCPNCGARMVNKNE